MGQIVTNACLLVVTDFIFNSQSQYNHWYMIHTLRFTHDILDTHTSLLRVKKSAKWVVGG